MITPRRAPVRPRVILPETGDSVAIDLAVEDLLQSRVIIEIVGGPGSGKTTALEHLAEVLFALPGTVEFLDEPHDLVVRAHASKSSVIYTTSVSKSKVTKLTFRLAAWTDDEILEYLWATCPSHCESVMTRLRGDPMLRSISGLPRLWRVVLDRMADDKNVSSVRTALQLEVQQWLQRPNVGEATREFTTHLADHKIARPWFYEITEDANSIPWIKLLQCRPILVLVATRAIIEKLGTDAEASIRVTPMQDLVAELALHVRDSETLQHLLSDGLKNKSNYLQALYSSVLHAAGAAWKPESGLNFGSALLPKVNWPGYELHGCNFESCELEEANFEKADLRETVLRDANLSRASLRNATLQQASLYGANLTGADLSGASAQMVDFRHANLTDAVLNGARLEESIFSGANLTRTQLANANLSRSSLWLATVKETNFSNANFTSAKLFGMTLHDCNLRGARFSHATMSSCDLEFAELPGANFEHANLASALLTATVMTGACLAHAHLREAKMADVQWEDVDLRDADMRGCVFHMGSSRSGLVGSPYPCHGSRTGFYTDPYDDRFHKSPEEIRKANLQGADLRGARIDGVDFYLIDLRGAKYDKQQAEHLRRCNAILDS